MLKISDTPVLEVMQECATLGAEVAFLVPTETGLRKSILDAHAGMRDFLKKNEIHDYSEQGQGQSEKRVLPLIWWSPEGRVSRAISLYRPETKSGDPRLWVSGLANRAVAGNLLVFAVSAEGLVVLNASDPRTRAALRSQDSELVALLSSKADRLTYVEGVLVGKLRQVCGLGFVDSLRAGDTGVGFTLESLLGIAANTSKEADFGGIELKASRKKRLGSRNRQTLFSQVPDWGISSCKSGVEILKRFGKFNPNTNRIELYHTLENVPNSYGLFLSNQESGELVSALKESSPRPEDVASWRYSGLKSRLLEKHGSTCWVEAETRTSATGREQFHYNRATLTGTPYSSHLPTLVELGVLTVDFTLSMRENGARDHGYLWRMKPEHLGLLFPPPRDLDIYQPLL
jgi:hypothetical protein